MQKTIYFSGTTTILSSHKVAFDAMCNMVGGKNSLQKDRITWNTSHEVTLTNVVAFERAKNNNNATELAGSKIWLVIIVHVIRSLMSIVECLLNAYIDLL